jgi:hypothetical protein
MKMSFFSIFFAALALVSCSPKDTGPKAISDPTDLSVTLKSDDSVELSWKHSGKDVEGWWMFCTKSPGLVWGEPVNRTDPLPAEARQYVFENLTRGETYRFGVKAKGNSRLSNVVLSEAIQVPPAEPGPVAGEGKVTMTSNEAGKTAEFKAKSAEGEDVLITLAPVSNNKTVQIDRYEIGSEQFRSYTDWIGPYSMKTVAPTTQTENLNGFVGGWHASNGDGTGSPTAQTQSIEISLDGKPFPSGTASCNEASVVVHNKVEALNTKLGESKRFVIDEDVTYTFKDSRLYVRVDITALEDVNIAVYYGMQIAGGFCSRFSFTTETGETFSTSGDFTCSGKVRDMVGYSEGGHSVTAHMFGEGLGTFSNATPSYSAFTQYYGAGNGKGYYMLIGVAGGGSNSLTLRKGESVYWSGYYEFR